MIDLANFSSKPSFAIEQTVDGPSTFPRFSCSSFFPAFKKPFSLCTTQTLISIKTLFLITGHTGNLTPKIAIDI